MNGYEFTWLSAMKLLGGILLAVVWYMMRKQAMLDKKYREENENAGQAHGSEPVPRLIVKLKLFACCAEARGALEYHYRSYCYVVDSGCVDSGK